MEEILKGLGYRAEAKPAADVRARLEALDEAERQRAAASAAEAAKADEAAGSEPPAESQAATTEEASAEAAQKSPAEAAAMPQDAPAGADDEAASPEPTEAEPTEAEAPVQETAGQPDDAGSQAEAQPAESAAAQQEETDEAPAEELKPVLLWRPARFEGRQRHGQRNARGANEQNRRGHGKRAQPGPAGAENDRSAKAEGRGRFDGKPKGKGGERRGDWKGERGKERQGRPRDGGPPKLDPDSPFAKLAALRDQLKK
jgi:ATP-dependent RNA helicase SUPV3L1/SUV3